MAKIYQPVKNNQYHLPRDIFMQSIYFIRGYDRRAEEAEAILDESAAPPDGMPRGTKIGDPVATTAGRREKLLAKNCIIDWAFDTIPAEYRQPIFDNIVYGTRYPMIDKIVPVHSHSTWSKYRARVIYAVAEALELM